MVLVIIVILIVLFMFTVHCHHQAKYINLGNGISCKIDRNEYMNKPTRVEEYMEESPDEDDYSQFMIDTGLESSILASHRTFADDLQNSTVGASAATEFSHDDDIVGKWGLRRKSSYIPVSVHARDIPSLTDEQMKRNARSSNPIAQALFG